MLLVVFYHAGLPVPGGFTGVDVFFVISGFVITGTLLGELLERGTISLMGFYARRIRRLLPALALMVVSVTTLGMLAAPLAAQRATASSGIWASLFAGNLYFYRQALDYFDLPTSLNPLLHTWTLGVEEQFYVFFPVLLLAAWWVGSRRRGWQRPLLVAATLVVSAVSLGISLAGSYGHSIPGVTTPDQFAFYMSPARAWEFGLGALVALLVPLAMRLPAFAAAVVGAVGAAAIGAGAALIDDTQPYPGLAALIPTLGVAALLVAGTAGTGPLTRLLATRPFVWIGDRSYSWYLWHWPLIVMAKALWPGAGAAAPAAASLSLVPAWASYRWVENPIRFGKRFRGARVLALAAACIAVSIACSAALAIANRQVLRTNAVVDWQFSQRDHADLTLGCASQLPLSDRPTDSCIWRVGNARGTIVLIGDSNAGHFTEPFLEAAANVGFDAVVATNNGCPFLDVRVDGTVSGIEGCRRFYLGSLAWLTQRRPNLVVTAARSDRYIEGPLVRLGASAAGGLSHDAATKARLWENGLESMLRRLAGADIPVVVVHPTPQLQTQATDCAAVRILLRRCLDSIERGELERIQRRAVLAERRAVAGVPTATAVSFRDALCEPRACPSRRDGIDLYRNSNHLSVAGSLTLIQDLEAAIKRHAR